MEKRNHHNKQDEKTEEEAAGQESLGPDRAILLLFVLGPCHSPVDGVVVRQPIE